MTDRSKLQERISRFLSGLLRHFPDKFKIKTDRYGWADLLDVARVVANKYKMSESEALERIYKIVKTDPKGRFELRNGKIRARYGHSIDVEVKWSDGGSIPQVLYHGTSRKAVKSILKKGLLPMNRKEVHLSESFADAMEVGRRYDTNPVVLKINAKKMIEDGYEIRRKGKVLTTDYVPPDYIEFLS
jgi:putative RNA 2'-phosphotransferase